MEKKIEDGIPPVPSQYKDFTENLIADIGDLAKKLYPFIAELGDSLEIEGKDFVVIIKRR